MKGHQSYHLHIFLSDKTQLIVKAMQLERQFLVLLSQSSIFIKQRKKLTLCLPKTLQLMKANSLKAYTKNVYVPKNAMNKCCVNKVCTLPVHCVPQTKVCFDPPVS